MTHLVEHDPDTYCGQYVSACGALVDPREEAQRLKHRIPVDCPACLTRSEQDDAAIADLQESR